MVHLTNVFSTSPFFSLWSFRQPHYGLAELRFSGGTRVFIFIRELRTDASLLSLIASGFSNPRCTHSQSAFYCCWPALQN
jgi:hypothetical protein